MLDAPSIRRVFATDSARVRAIRLEALSDPAADIAFLDTYENAVSQPASFWQERTIGAALSGEVAQFIAEAGPRWVGTATVLLPEPGSADYFGRIHSADRALLVGVYVAPSHRGSEVLEALADRAGEWAQERGRKELALDVHADNARAQAAYRRLGFVATGETSDSAQGIELEMVRAIGRK